MNLTLSRRDSTLLKGVAILAIVMHNFCHWLPGCVVENEYMFHAEYSCRMAEVLKDFGPHVVLNFFSYFGHYGVPLFLFISGYGLVCKYERPEHRDMGVPFGRFLAYNVLKLWKLMIPAVLLLVACETVRCGSFRHGWDDVAYMLGFVTNFLPNARDSFLHHRDLLLGPWWYFSLTLQMYLLWRICYYRHGKLWIVASICISLFAQVMAVTLLSDKDQSVLDYLRYNLVGCLLPFAFGVWVARYGLRLTPVRWVAALVLFVAGCFNVFLWMLTPVMAVVVLYPLCRMRGMASRFFCFFGSMSAALFAIHPIVRGFYLSPYREVPVYSSLAAYLAISFLSAWLLSQILKRIPIFKF